MDNGFSIVTDLLSKLVSVAIQEASYPFRINKYIKELETEKENLESKIEGVLDREKEAKKKTEKVVKEVKKWLNEANSLMTKVVVLDEKIRNRNKAFCLRCFPNLIRRYSLAKELEEKTNEIIKHINKFEFPEFSRLATLAGMSFFSSQGFVHFESRHVAYDGLLKGIKDDKVQMIGLYGMGGCGKTNLVKEVGKEAEQFFDKVIFVGVSNTIDIRKIQQSIASQLGNLKLQEDEEPERARRLSMRLSSGEQFLIILDDVWEKIELEAIGIPNVENKKGCTILITTRKLQVCRLMDCIITIHLESLKEDEAWTLFQKHSRFDDDSSSLKSVAQEIAKECSGLPVAIAAVASTLRGKPRVEWVEALKTLKDSSLVDIEKGIRSPYACLQLSYDYLDNEVAKSLFLLCSVFPEDYEIPIDQLTIIGVGLGLLGEVSSYQRARDQLITKGKNVLVDSCLLLQIDDWMGPLVKMHDLVRDVALSIAGKKNKLIMGQLKEDKIIKDDKISYLWLDKVDKFPDMLDYPQLQFLWVSSKSKNGVYLANDFFKGMEKLKVLTLENIYYFSKKFILQWPKSVHFINNLCCLFLYGWLLGDISFIGNLKELQSLTLWFCAFEELPKCIVELKTLRLLDVWGCEIKRNPYEVLGRCSQLEALYFSENMKKYEGNEEDEDNEHELGAELLEKISFASTLESYCITLGKDNREFGRRFFPITRSLFVEDFDIFVSNATIKDLMPSAEVLSLKGIHRSCKNVIPDLFRTIGGLNDLTQLELHYSDGIECIIGDSNNLSQIAIISNLTHLTLTRVKHLKSLYHGQPLRGLFANLEKLKIRSCDSLEHIMATDETKEILEDSEYHRTCGFLRLKELRITNCKKVEYLLPISFSESLAQLEILSVADNEKLKSLFGHSIYEDSYQNKLQIIKFSALSDLSLYDLPNLISIFPENYRPTWPSLKTLCLDNCPQLNVMSINLWIASYAWNQDDDKIVSEDLLKAVVTQSLKVLSVKNDKMEVVFDAKGIPINGQLNSRLRYLELHDLLELQHIWRAPKNCLCLQNLERLELSRCGNLKVIFPSYI